MSTLPEPPDLDPDEDRITELASLLPEPAEEFTQSIHARLDQEALATNVATLAWSGMVDGFLQLFSALMSMLGASPSNDTAEDEDE